jgi:DNA recombination protein RmuC
MEIALVIVGFVLGALVASLVARERVRALRGEVVRERAAGAERVALLDEAERRLQTTLKALAADALRDNNQSFLALARTQLEQKEKAVEHLVAPLKESLQKVDGKLQQLEVARVRAYSDLAGQVRQLADTQRELRQETGNLVTALRSPQVRGRWGEMQLRRVVEMAGMLSHCDFLEQQTTTVDDRRLRPDLIVKLPGGKNVVVDAKAPLQAYLAALECKDEDERRGYLADHARQIRDHIAKLSAKSYWSQFEQTPEFVVLFIPGETFFSAALEHDPGLIEEGVNQQVILATPTTLIALLRSVAYGWRQETIAESARAISDLGRELYGRMATLTEHVAKMGRGLDGAVRAYNEAVGSLEQRVLPSARRFKEHGVSPTAELAELPPVERAVRSVQAPELDAAGQPSLPAVDAA